MRMLSVTSHVRETATLGAISSPILLFTVDITYSILWVAVIIWCIGGLFLLVSLARNYRTCLFLGILPCLCALFLTVLSEVVSFYWMPQSIPAVTLVLSVTFVCWALICMRLSKHQFWTAFCVAFCVAIVAAPLFLDARDLKIARVSLVAEALPTRIAFVASVIFTVVLAFTRSDITGSGIVLSAFFIGVSLQSPIAKYLCSEDLLRYKLSDYANGDSTLVYIWLLSLSIIPFAIFVAVTGVSKYLRLRSPTGAPGNE